jgi:signal transduction histidine kinase
VTRPAFWVVAALLLATTVIHYLTPQVRWLPFSAEAFLSRHAVERILFVLPVAVATLAFGWRGGALTLALSVLVMLPRAIWISPTPADASVETAATVLVAGTVVWAIEAQAREKRLHQKMVSQLQALNSITTIVTGSLELEQILTGALDQVLQVLSLDAGLLFTADRRAQRLTLVAYRGMPEEAAARIARLGMDQDTYGRVARSGELVVLEDISRGSQAAETALLGEGLRSCVFAPLESKGVVQGVLAVGTRDLRRFAAEELDLLTAVSNGIGVAVENARLHRDVARQLQIQRRLNDVAQEITSELELDRILPRVLQIATELAGADGGMIALLDQEHGLVRYPHLHNLPRELMDVAVPVEQGISGEVITTGHPIALENYQAYPKAVPAFAAAGVAGVAAVPILSGEHLFGALGLVTLHETKRFSDQDVAILTGVGRQAGIAVENARLYANMRFYARQITQAQEDERKRIARELHDDTVQMLILLSRRLEALATHPEPLPDVVREQLGSLQQLISSMLRDVRRFAQDLRPPTLDHLGLVATMEGLTGDLTEKDRIEAEFRVTGSTRRFTPEQELVLFRIAQEALSNVRRHSGATRAAVDLEFCPNAVRITVEDNGRGFNAPDRIDDLVSTGKLGLIGMHERARTLGGTLTIQSEPGQGTKVIADIPV